ncbi:hypothetical protein C8A03DRAFT_17001 [Achaetomium macrosporum]|uniref:Rhodopsin domain-containing protein n=1 Tax=Achaetomium macrosporum TaxID=79813 RepID=A0AAN7C6K2_9PEZI|nr:hypothetical protein C8A03DRAFT_17001 [Achaetomium macrosporum]
MAARDAYYPLVITFLVLNTAVVALRLYTRVWSKSLGYDDAVLVLALAGFIIFGAFEMQAVHYGIGATAMEPQFDAMLAAKYFTVAQLVYILASGITKVAVALVLLRLTSRSDMRAARLVLTTVIGQAALALSIEDVVTSWASAVKLTIYILLGFGAVSSVATIVRLKYVIIVQNLQGEGGLAAAQIVSTTVEATIYSILEIALSIFAASLAALRPLLRKLGVFSETSSPGKSGPNAADGSYHLRTFGQMSSRDNAGAIRLDDADSDSQRGIITATKMHEYAETK